MCRSITGDAEIERRSSVMGWSGRLETDLGSVMKIFRRNCAKMNCHNYVIEYAATMLISTIIQSNYWWYSLHQPACVWLYIFLFRDFADCIYHSDIACWHSGSILHIPYKMHWMSVLTGLLWSSYHWGDAIFTFCSSRVLRTTNNVDEASSIPFHTAGQAYDSAGRITINAIASASGPALNYTALAIASSEAS